MAIIAVGDTLSVADGGTVNIQPASGEVWLIDSWYGGGADTGPSGTGVLAMFDGTDAAHLVATNDGTTIKRSANMRLVLSNSQYGRMKNNAGGGAINHGYRGVKL